jgi:hypothetical protein
LLCDRFVTVARNYTFCLTFKIRLSNLRETGLEYVIRFVAGGVVVSAFAVLGDMLRPKSFAGLFGAAPSIALATLSLAFWKQGGGYAAIEGRSMVLGSIALAAYCFVVCQLLMRVRWSALTSTAVAAVAWFAVALGLKAVWLG